MANKIRALLIDVENEVVQDLLIEDSLNEFYRLINCRTIDIVNRAVYGKRFSIICDDEGLFIENPKISAVDGNLSVMLVGNLLVVSADFDDEGNLIGLTDDDVEHLKRNVVKLRTSVYTKPYPMLYPVEY